MLSLLLSVASENTLACDEHAFRLFAPKECDNLREQCLVALKSRTRTERSVAICEVGGTCNIFYKCVEKQLLKTGCSGHPLLGAGLKEAREACATTSTMAKQCLDKKTECMNSKNDPTSAPTPSPTSTPFSWQDCGAFQNLTNGQTYEDQYGPYSASRGPSTLPQSRPGQLLVLEQIAADCSEPMPVARSYDGHAWEGVPPRNLQPECHISDVPQDTHACVIIVPEICPDIGMSCSYRVTARSGLSLQPNQTVARLFRQATFGTTMADLRSFFKDHDTRSVSLRSSPSPVSPSSSASMLPAISSWLHTQMNETATPPTLLPSPVAEQRVRERPAPQQRAPGQRPRRLPRRAAAGKLRGGLLGSGGPPRGFRQRGIS